MRMQLKRTAAAIAMVLGLAAGAAQAQDAYPSKPINLIVSFPPGGSTDIGARVIGAIAEKALGQSIIIVNKGGAGGQVGWTELSRAKPDGYTIGFLNLPATNTVILDPDRKAIFKEDAFIPIINQVLDPGVVWVRADSKYKTMKDLLEDAKARPGQIKAADTGILSDDHLAILMTEEAYPGANFRLVHLEGGAAQMKEILAGNIDVAFDNVGSIVARIKTGELRALVVTDHERSKFLPDVPTMKELGYPTVISSSTRGIAAPKGTPQAVIDKLAAVLEKAMQDPDHVKKLEEQGLAIKMMKGADYAKYFADIHAQAKKYTEWAKARPQK